MNSKQGPVNENQGFNRLRLSITKKHNWLTQFQQIMPSHELPLSQSIVCFFLWYLTYWILDSYSHNESPRTYAEILWKVLLLYNNIFWDFSDIHLKDENLDYLDYKGRNYWKLFLECKLK
jgi:hypothetical protein